MTKLNNFKIVRMFAKDINNKVRTSNKLVNLESPRGLSRVLERFSWKLVSLILRSRTKATARIRLYHRFGLYVLQLYKRNGSLYVVKYLKACSLAIQKAVANQPFSSLKEIEPDYCFPRLSKSGLPVIIGSRDRRAIMAGSKTVIQLYLTLFGLYRLIDAPVKAKLGTITEPYSGSVLDLKILCRWFGFNSKHLFKDFMPKLDLRAKEYSFITKSSPSNKSSWQGLITDALFLSQNKRVHTLVKCWLRYTNSEYMKEKFNAILDGIRWEVKTGNSIVNMRIQSQLKMKPSVSHLEFYGLYPCPIGQLSFKKEAAGKLRIFAMVDSWTQTLMRPLHDWLFEILRSIPNDGTFNQEEAFNRALEKSKAYNCCYAYDLSSATDRLPLKLQIAILASLLGSLRLAVLWGKLLTARPYRIPENEFGVAESNPGIFYTVGQPMGALSSWGMLAITHHAIMQHISNRGFKPEWFVWEERYEVLGDDIVIFDSHLAQEYVKFMDQIGVPINQSKSVIAENSAFVEFAKRTGLDGVDVSPISWEMFKSQDSLTGRLSIIQYLAGRKFNRPIGLFNLILAKRIWDRRPEKFDLGLLGLFSTLFNKGVITFYTMLNLLSNCIRRNDKFGLEVYSFPRGIIQRLLTAYYTGTPFDPSGIINIPKYWLDRGHHQVLYSELSRLVKSHDLKWYKSQINSIVKAVNPPEEMEELVRLILDKTFEHYLVELKAIRSKLLVFQQWPDQTRELKTPALFEYIERINVVILALTSWKGEEDKYKNLDELSLSKFKFVTQAVKPGEANITTNRRAQEHLVRQGSQEAFRAWLRNSRRNT